MMLESRWRFFRKHRSVWYSRLYRVAMFCTCVVRVWLVLLVWPVSRPVGIEGSMKTVLGEWIAKFRWTIGRERWVKNY